VVVMIVAVIVVPASAAAGIEAYENKNPLVWWTETGSGVCCTLTPEGHSQESPVAVTL